MKALKPAEFRMLATAAGISGAVLLLGVILQMILSI